MTVIRPILAFTDEDGWHAGIGDPTVLGWVTVVGYFVAGLLAFRAAWKVRHEPGKLRVFWSSLTLVLILLGINKQLDLQTAFTELGRVMAVEEGWYKQRQTVQMYFIIGVGLFCGWASITLLVWARHSALPTWLALVGTTSVIGYVLIRAASFHHIDRFLGSSILGFRWNWVLEMGGISLTLIASVWRRKGLH